MHLSAIKWIDGWIVTRTRVRLVATAGTYPRLFVSFSLLFVSGLFAYFLLFCSCLLSLLSVFSSHTGSSAICLLVSQFSCLLFANVVFFFLHFFSVFSTSMGPRMTGTAILPEGGGVRGIRPDVSRRTLAPSSGSLSQLLFSFSSVWSIPLTHWLLIWLDEF